MITHKVEETLAELSSTGSSAKRICLVSWNGNPAKLDLRVWRTVDGETKPGKGLTLTDEEAETLLTALTDYFGK